MTNLDRISNSYKNFEPENKIAVASEEQHHEACKMMRVSNCKFATTETGTQKGRNFVELKLELTEQSS